MDAPLINIPPDMRGVRLIQELGHAYEYEEEHACSWLIRQAKELTASLRQSGLDERSDVSRFIDELKSAIEFLQSGCDESVTLYSYDRTPSTNDVLTAFADGPGANDWAIQEVSKKGEKGRKALLAVLKKEEDKEQVLAAISMLLIVFRNEETVAAIQRYIDKCDGAIGQDAAKLFGAYRSLEPYDKAQKDG